MALGKYPSFPVFSRSPHGGLVKSALPLSEISRMRPAAGPLSARVLTRFVWELNTGLELERANQTVLIDEEVLEVAAKDGNMNYEKWPSLLEPLIERLEQIVHNDFPMPTVPPALSNTFDTPTLIPSSYSTQEINSQTNSNKENAPPSQLQTPPRRPPVPTFPSSGERIPDSQPQSGPTDDALPPPLVAILASIKSTLKSSFSSKPPHTIQRLAELILRPTLHYRTLPAYLRAVDRVVSVSSGADIFPLPLSMPPPSGGTDSSLVNGVNGSGSSSFMFSDNSLGSDESLGGALLTPIPWLSNSALPGGNHDSFMEPDSSPNSSPGASSPESATSSVVPARESGAVTQGELIRQEQEAGVVPMTVQRHQRQHAMTDGELTPVEDDDTEEAPHARGPAILGVEDMGLQDGRGVQMSLSTSPTSIDDISDESGASSSVTIHASAADSLDGGNINEDTDMDADGDIVIVDMSDKAAGKAKEEQVGQAPAEYSTLPPQGSGSETIEPAKTESADTSKEGPTGVDTNAMDT
ncbi:hypothetical protein FQN52_008267 [Onygenales sp. PD_12]|nr:hypothetical protein FQN52_008267 [Onygenales sp. PD_12]